MSLRVPAAVVTTMLLLLAACGDDDGSTKDEDVASSTTSTDTSGDDGIGCEAGDPDDLESLVAVDVPAAFEVQPDDYGDTGPSDFEKAVSDDGEDDAAEALRSAGFRRGYQRLWENVEDGQLIAFVYEFCDDAGADAYAHRFEVVQGPGIPTFVPDLPDALGYISSEDDFGIAVVLVSPGPYTIQAVANGPAGAVTEAELQELATDLAANLVDETATN